MTRKEQASRSDKTRQEILNTALEIGIEEGFEAVTIRKIINKMKYSTGVVYHYFKDKQEVIDAIEKSETDWLRSEIMALQDNTKDIVWNMKTTFHKMMQLAHQEPEKYNLIVLHKYSRQKPAKPEWISYLSERMKHGMEAGIFREMDPEKAALSIWSSFMGFHLMISRYSDLSPEQAEKMFLVQFDILFKGVLVHE